MKSVRIKGTGDPKRTGPWRRRGMLHSPQSPRGCPMRALTLALALLSFPLAAFAVDLGKAAGSVTVDSTRIDLYYAYAVGNQKNEITRRSDEVKVVITNKRRADWWKLDEFDLRFPGD